MRQTPAFRPCRNQNRTGVVLSTPQKEEAELEFISLEAASEINNYSNADPLRQMALDPLRGLKSRRFHWNFKKTISLQRFEIF